MIACAAFLLLPILPAAADDPLPDSETIYARVTAALGAPQHNYEEVTDSERSNHVRWRVIRYVDGANVRRRFLGESTEEQDGTYRGDAWHQNINGLTVMHDPEPGLATGETLTTSVTRIRQPVAGYRVAKLNVHGFGSIDYVDSSTWQIVRTETVDADGTSVCNFGPLVSFGPVKKARTWHFHDAESHLDTDTTVVSYQPGIVTDDDVAIPSNRRRLVEFPPGVQSVVLPATFQDDRIYVMLTIDGRGYDFVLDTGTSGITVDPGAAKKLGLKLFDPSAESTDGGSVTVGRAKISAATVGPLAMHDLYVDVIPYEEQADGVQAIGLLGFDFLAELGVQIDYVHQTVTVHKYGSYTVPQGQDVNVLPIRLASQIPMVSAKINGATAERIVIDTGASAPFFLFDYFARRHPESLIDHRHEGAYSYAVDFEGVGGAIKTKPYVISEIILGSQHYLDFLGYLETAKGGDMDGLFGIGFLRLYDLYLDYPHGLVAIRLNKTGRRGVRR